MPNIPVPIPTFGWLPSEKEAYEHGRTLQKLDLAIWTLREILRIEADESAKQYRLDYIHGAAKAALEIIDGPTDKLDGINAHS